MLLRIDNKSARLRRGLVNSTIDAYIGTDISENDINRLYIELSRLIDESPPLPAHINDIKIPDGDG